MRPLLSLAPVDLQKGEIQQDFMRKLTWLQAYLLRYVHCP